MISKKQITRTKSLFTDLNDKKQLENQIENLKRKLDEKEKTEELIEDLLHELRRVNREVKRISGSIITDNTSDDIKTLWALTNLLSMRMSTFDYEVNPQVLEDSVRYPIKIYPRIERVYKSLRSMYKDKKVDVKIKGNSLDRYKSTDLVDIALFIVIDNAFKYALENTPVVIGFEKIKKENTLRVKITNTAVLPDDDEMNNLTERTYRGRNTRNAVKGRGLGLNIFKKICEASGLSYGIYLNRNGATPTQGDFIVSIYFKNVF